ncbi:ATP-binding protein [Caldisalinibacter kiritimatiensis]|uniref:DNA double-strand break repair Rad50 ATPase n=1 Tax=Caldisalinibacter kiritimatiensis TaxID=1304284 RepID=R1CQC2_9FIRM|nr:AAA family ATPase [Caldisalinibacter kiritimatiensis]EOD00871.1 DNA double-strand break repair Rad50 ATPase [Caldisalinibacter kiritimatiensis]
MIIKELILISFGKFINKKLEFKNGINIIYGDNEAGKTTLHKFIEGMFFGFFKPYTKRKVYTDEYDKYFPWENNDYRGILKYLHDNEVYRIERNFLKGNDEVKIIDDKTGEDITHIYEYDKVIRLPNPASRHLGLNRVVYNNTINIKQLGNKTDDDLAKEVKDSLINLGGSMDEDISVKSVIERLANRMDNIGTKKRIKTSPYGKIIAEINSLEKERQKSLRIMNEVKEQQKRLNEINNQIKELKNTKRLLENNLELIEVYRAKDKYNKALHLIEDINKLTKDTKSLKRYEKVNSEEYTEVVKMDNSLKTIEEGLNNLKGKYNKIKNKIRRIQKNIEELASFDKIQDSEEIDRLLSDYMIMENQNKELISIKKKIEDIKKELEEGKNLKVSDINEDFYKYEELQHEKDELLYNKDYANVTFLKARLDEKEKGYKRLKIYKVMCIVGALAFAPLGIIFDPLLFLTTILPLSLFAYFILAGRETKNYLNKLNTQLKSIEEEEQESKARIKEIENQMEEILNKYGCKTKTEFRKLINKYSREASFIEDRQIQLKELKQRKEYIINEIKGHESIIRKYLTLAGVESEINFDNVKKVRQKYNKYLELKKFNISLKQEMNEIQQEIENNRVKYDNISKKLVNILEKNNVQDIKEFKEALNEKKKYIELTKKLENKNNLLKSILGDTSIEYLKKKAEESNSSYKDNIKKLDKNKIKSELKEVTSTIIDKRHEITRIEEKIKNLTSKTRPVVDIEEDMMRKNKIKEEYESKLKALKLAKDTIERISKNIQRDFAPRLNKKVSNIINKVTAEKYNEVKITEKIDIRIVDPKTSKLVNIEELSGGTIDQIYFATRFGIIDIIKGDNNIPLILDDCFVQYDLNRLESILSFLANVSQERQILLFTCHRREKEVFDRLGIEYNYIELTH